MEHLSNCPVCNGLLTDCLSATDFTVSRETFGIMKCLSCSALITNPRPDKNSISRYYQSEDYISHSGTSKGLVNKLYNLAKIFSIDNKCKQTIHESKVKTGRILDYGCGRGDFLLAMKKRGWVIDGIEPDLKTAQVASYQTGISIYDPDSTALPASSFDVITLWHVLEHVHNLHETIGKLKTLLKNNGVMLIALPNVESFDAHYYKSHWAAYDVPRHLYHFNRKAMFALLHKHHLKCTAVKPMALDAFYVSMLSEKYRQSALGLLRGFLIGFYSDFQAIMNGQWSSLIYVCRNDNDGIAS